ncbi:hypothetical protein [Aestuariivivens sediminis]|uniref:hypothetical protein n=1 Tax=Aestuariivivens sediminis TaxID=2913557 RepID=UPI001F57D8ED|nr:hypothetical protein [Aestuariivivens sediminis]
MKNFRYLIVIISTALCISCEEDGGTSVRIFEDGIVPNMQLASDSAVLFDLTKINAGTNVEVSFSADVAQGTAVSTDIMGYYTTATGNVYNAILFNNVSLPDNFTLSINDVVSAFSELATIDDVLLGDALAVSTRFTRSDGTVLSIINANGSSNVNQNITNSGLYTTVLNFPVSCPTMLEGSYTSTVIASNLDIASNFRSPQPVTITQPSSGTYLLSDGTADIFGPDFPIGLNFTDVCGTITVLSPSVDFPGLVDYIDLGSSLDQDSGIITLDLEYTSGSCCGLPGIKYTLQLTPNP